MGMIIRVKGVNWAGKGFPLANGFIAQANLEAAYDFRPRASRLLEVTGKGFLVQPYLNKLDGTVVADPTVIRDTTNGQGIIVKNGFIDYGVANKTYTVGGSDAFTLMVVGGYSGLDFEAGQPANNASICNLAEMGNGVSSGPTLPMLQQYRVDGTLGARANAAYSSNVGAAEAVGKKSCFFVSYDGAKMTYTNKTTGAVVVKTNAELGLPAGPLAPATRAKNLTSGNYYLGTTAVIGLYPELYQVARWNKVLSAAEMQDQYNSSRLLFSKVGI